jgi:hypothetical protein
VGYIKRGLPTDSKDYRAWNQVYDARGVRPTMTSSGQGALLLRQGSHRAKYFDERKGCIHHRDANGNFIIVRTSTPSEDMAMLLCPNMYIAKSIRDKRAQMAKAQDPQMMLALGATLHHVLDSAHCLSPLLAVPFTLKTVLKNRSDALLPAFDLAVNNFQSKLVAREVHFRKHGVMPEGPPLRPLILPMSKYWTSPAFFGHIVDFTNEIPVGSGLSAACGPRLEDRPQ